MYLPATTMALVMDSSPIPCVDIVFYNEDLTKTLLFKRANAPAKGIWYTMGGRIWKNERFLDCAIRKALEELGLNIDPKRLIGPVVTEDSWKDSVFPDVSYHAVAICFAYILTSCDIESMRLDQQHEESCWRRVDNPRHHPYIKKRLELLEPLLCKQ